jgi:hypothetical protein
MKAAFLLYSLDQEDKLNVYYTSDSFPSRAFIASPKNYESDVIYEILQELELEIDSPRVTYLGTFNFDGVSPGNDTLDAIAINVSSLNMKPLMEKYKLKEKLAYEIGQEENSFILSLMMKLILNMKKKKNNFR